MNITRRLLAIGDIHGELEALNKLLGWIESDPAPAEVIFLGDYIDRGPDSRGVVARLMAGPRRVFDRWRFVKGNHEDMMIKALSGRMSDMHMWHVNGGEETLQSYGGSVDPDHVDWLDKLPTFIETERHWFVHAGIYPALHPTEHSPQALMWMRSWEDHIDNIDTNRKYLTEADERVRDGAVPYEKHVVYGHTPRREVFRRPHCTGLDTGGCFGWQLTCAEFARGIMGGPLQIMQVDMKSGALIGKEFVKLF